MNITEAERQKLEHETVELILEIRRAYLAAGANALKHWDQLQARVRMAARTSGSLAEWMTQVCKHLNLSAPSNSLSLATKTLAFTIESSCHPNDWLDLVESEHAYLMALARMEAQKRKNKPEPTTDELVSEAVGER